MNRFGLLIIIMLTSCLTTMAGGKINIVATTSDLATIAKSVAGDRAEVHSICSGKEDPHTLQAKPGFIMLARNADLWIRIGLELEIGWESPVLDGSRNNRIRPGYRNHMDASENVLVLDIPQTSITRAMGDVHPMGNPHYWLDPLNGRRLAGAIADRLAMLDPANTAHYRQNAATFQKTLDERMFGAVMVQSTGAEALWAKTQDGSIGSFLNMPANKDKVGGWVAAMLPLRGKKIVTYHRSWVYFTHRFGLDIVAELEPKPGVPPTAAHLTGVAETARAGDVKIVLQELFYSTRAAKQLAAKTGARIVAVANSVGGQPEATDYLALMDLLVRQVSGSQ